MTAEPRATVPAPPYRAIVQCQVCGQRTREKISTERRRLRPVGLRLLSPRDAARRTLQERTQRPGVYCADDVVIGEFLGDQDLVVIAPSVAGRRRVLIALPMDDRSGWYAAAENFVGFLDGYLKAFGDKHWESGE